MKPSRAYGLAGLWAGVALGGSLVAAPAKFRAPSLTLEVALDVGRAQFLWLGLTEALLCAALLIGLVCVDDRRWRWPLLATGILAVQRLIIMPPLDVRTLQVIAGEPAPPSSLHVIYIAAEIVKFLLLTAIAVRLLKLTGDGERA